MNMKTLKNIIALFAIFCLVACEPVKMPEQNWTVTHSIGEFIEDYMTEAGVLFPVRTRANGDYAKNLFSVDTIPAGGPDIVICGRLISDDLAGTLYKTLVIQDVNKPDEALKLAVDAGSISGLYAMGQVIKVRCNGLSIGKYANQAQLCVPSYNNNRDAMKADEKVGWCPGRIPLPIFQKAVQCVGAPDVSAIVVDTMTIDQIKSTSEADIQKLCGRLVYIKNVHFNNMSQGETVLKDADPTIDQDAATFAPTTNFIGFQQSRDIEDANGNWISVSSSEYAKFANIRIPSEEYSGDILGIVGYYRDNATKNYANTSHENSWSITIRSLDDIFFKSKEDGSPWQPEEWSK